MTSVAGVGEREEGGGAGDGVEHGLELRPANTWAWHRRNRLFQVLPDFEYALEGSRLAGMPE